MRRNLIYFLAVILTFSLSYCGKDGSIGPEGPRGERGEKGDRGDKGAKGDDGTSILSGKGAPSSSVGDVGDFYLDLSSSNLYGPKTASGWGSPTSIQGDKGDKGATGAKGEKGDKGATGAKGDKGDKGATGAKGQDGSQFLSGTSIPDASLGKVGDFYFHTSTTVLYGPKTASGWGSGTSLRGPKGAKGDKGEDGNANVISSGWVKLDASKWDNSGGYKSPNDISGNIFVTNSQFSLSNDDLNGVVLVYVKNLQSTGRPSDVMLLPVQDKIHKNGQNAGVELRFSHSGDPNFAKYLTLNVGLISGSWNTTYIKNTYLPSLEWKVVRIPATLAKKHERELSNIDLNNHNEVVKYFNLKE